MTDRDDRIREIAYFLWLEEGCPEGVAESQWLAAETRLESDPLERKRIEGEPPGEPKERVPVGNGDGGVGLTFRPIFRSDCSATNGFCH